MGKSGRLVSLVAELAAYGQQSLIELVRATGRVTFSACQKTVISFCVVPIISPTTRIPRTHRGRARHSIAAVRYSPEGDSKIGGLELACLEQGRSALSRDPVECGTGGNRWPRNVPMNQTDPIAIRSMSPVTLASMSTVTKGATSSSMIKATPRI